MKYKNKPSDIVLIEQFRPPVNANVIEFPAGLIDEGETAQQAAIRELNEETGFKGDNIRVIDETPVIFNDPGMSSANMKHVTLVIDLDDNSPKPIQQLDEGEFITMHVVSFKDLHKHLLEFSNQGKAIDARLSHLGIGIDMAQRFSL